MNDLALLHRGVCANPADNTARLVYADALQEAGDDARAEFIRTQIELSNLVPAANCPNCKIALSPLKKDRFPLLAACAKCGREAGFWKDQQEQAQRESTLRARESALLASRWHLWHSNPKCVAVACLNLGTPAYEPRPNDIDVHFERGFLSSLTCTTAVFLENTDALLWHPEQTMECPNFECRDGASRIPRLCPPTAQPVTRVTLTTESGALSFTRDGDGWAVARFPGIKFSLPQGSQVNFMLHTLHGMLRVPDELLNSQLLPTQADEQRADLAEAWAHAEVPRTGWLVEKLTPRLLEEVRDIFDGPPTPASYVKSVPRVHLRLYFTLPPGTRFGPECEGTKLRDVTGFDRSGNAYRFVEIIITRTMLAHSGPHRDNGIEIEAESCGAFEVMAR